MFFQISPTIKKKPQKLNQAVPDNEESNIEILSLAPFTPNPKILFENVHVGTIQRRKLLIKNPNQYDINLFIKSFIPEEINLAFSWSEIQVSKSSEVLLEMTWAPRTEEACRYHFTLSDGKRTNRDVAVTLKSSFPKQTKATRTKAKQKSQKRKSPIKLPLSRKPISPSKKLKTPRKGSNKLCDGYSSCFSIHQMQQQFYESPLHDNPLHTENKENDLRSNRLESLNVTPMYFVSPRNVNFYLENENPARRETYILSKECKETYISTVGEIPTLIVPKSSEFKDSFKEFKDTFTIEDSGNSPVYRDSLETSSIGLPLQERNNQSNITPSLESILNARERELKTREAQDFEYKLKIFENSIMSPVLSPYSTSSHIFLPSTFSTTTKPPSANNSSSGRSKCVDLFPTSEPTVDLNISNLTYVKGNLSSETYVKCNSSMEAYVKNDVSGGTYTKENCENDISCFDLSPLSSKIYDTKSPVYLKPKSREFLPTIESNINWDGRKGTNLSCIAEESTLNESSARIKHKRKSPNCNLYPLKRGKLSTEAKTSWSKKGGAAFRVSKSTSGLNLRQFSQQEQTPLSEIVETNVKSIIVQNPFLYANIIDPFLSSQVYSNDEWFKEQEEHFRKWMNALLTPPEELHTKTEVDVAKVWQECKKKRSIKCSYKRNYFF